MLDDKKTLRTQLVAKPLHAAALPSMSQPSSSDSVADVNSKEEVSAILTFLSGSERTLSVRGKSQRRGNMTTSHSAQYVAESKSYESLDEHDDADAKAAHDVLMDYAGEDDGAQVQARRQVLQAATTQTYR
jgi:hypothetical protein